MIASLKASVAAVAVLGLGGLAHASTLVIEDDNGTIGLVNTQTGAVSNVHTTTASGNTVTLTDVAYTSNGTLYGNDFNNLYTINLSNGALTRIGPNNAFGGSNINALVGNSSGGLLGAADDSTTIFNVNTSNAALTNSGLSSPSGTANRQTYSFFSAGDLAFANGALYELALCSGNGCNNAGFSTVNDYLIDVTTGTVVGEFSLGNTHFDSVFGLAFDGTTMFAVDGTDIYTVDLTTGHLTFDADYANNQGLGADNGATAAIAATPLPGAVILFGTVLFGGLGASRWRKQNRRRAASVLA